MSEETTVGQTSNTQPRSYVEQLSWEYLMPKRKERMAGYIRESREDLLESATIDSQAKAVRQYGEKEGYLYDVTKHEYREAISAYTVPYMERKRLLDALAAAKRHEFDVLVVTEIRALSRRQVEVFVIYDTLQKYGVRLETITERFEDSAMGRYILATRAMIAEVERENTYSRLQRGKKDRREAGNLNGTCKATYGYMFVDTPREQKAYYVLNTAVIYVDSDGTGWTEPKVILFIFDLANAGNSLSVIAKTLTDMGIPIPKNGQSRNGKEFAGYWHRSTVTNILQNRKYIGENYANVYKVVKGKVIKRPQEEWVRLPDTPIIVDRDVFEAVQEQLRINQQDSIRNNQAPKEELGILRAGYCRCGICGGSMTVRRWNKGRRTRYPSYTCRRRDGKKGTIHHHSTWITMQYLDREAWNFAVPFILDPAKVKAKVEELRAANQPDYDPQDTKDAIEKIRQKMQNLYTLAENAPDDEELARITKRMQELGKEKRDAEALLYEVADDEEEREKLEAEIVRFEQWANEVRPYLTDPNYVPSYEFQRLAVRILGLTAIIFPEQGGYPFRGTLYISPPKIMKQLGVVPTFLSPDSTSDHNPQLVSIELPISNALRRRGTRKDS